MCEDISQCLEAILLSNNLSGKENSEKGYAMTARQHYDYDIAISYAGEDGGYADALAKALLNRGVKVFYAPLEQANLLGENLYDYLTDLYHKRARYCVMFLSQHYAAKLWTNLERQAAQAPIHFK